MKGLLAAGRWRLLLAAIIVSVALGVVAMHQLAASHDRHVGTPAAAVMMVMDDGGDIAANSAVSGLAGTAAVCVLAAGCLWTVALVVLRPARWSGASYPVSRSFSAYGGFASGAHRPMVRAWPLSRLQLSVCRT